MSTLWATFSGGKSTRFGSPKQWALCDGLSLLDISIKRMKEAALAADYTVVCVANASDASPSDLDFSLLLDDPLCGGPAAGLLSAIRHAMLIGADALVFQAVDMPRFNAQLLSGLRSKAIRHEAVAIAVGAESNDVAWTLGAISAPIFQQVEQRIIQLTSEGRGTGSSPGLRAVFAHLNVVLFPVSDVFLRNVNTPDELLAILQEPPTNS